MEIDPTLNEYIKHNLHYWTHKKWNFNKMIRVLNNYGIKYYLLEISNGNVKVLNIQQHKLNRYGLRSIQFIQDIINKFTNISCLLILYANDTAVKNNIEVYDLRDNKIDNPNHHPFLWGISENNNNVLRINNSTPISELNQVCPIFSFERHRTSKSILFPAFGGDSKNIKNIPNIDNFKWKDKDLNTLISRQTNIVADLEFSDKIHLVNYSYKNPNIMDFKFSCNKKHQYFKDYLCGKPLLKLYQNLGHIDTNINIDLFYEYFNINNFISYNTYFRHKYIVTVSSAKNRKFYNSNSCILEYKFKNKEFFHEQIFEDMKDIVYFTLENLTDKLNQLKHNNHKLAKQIIENRKIKFQKYLTYDNLIDFYGRFLLKYNKMFHTQYIQ